MRRPCRTCSSDVPAPGMASPDVFDVAARPGWAPDEKPRRPTWPAPWPRLEPVVLLPRPKPSASETRRAVSTSNAPVSSRRVLAAVVDLHRASELPNKLGRGRRPLPVLTVPPRLNRRINFRPRPIRRAGHHVYRMPILHAVPTRMPRISLGHPNQTPPTHSARLSLSSTTRPR